MNPDSTHAAAVSGSSTSTSGAWAVAELNDSKQGGAAMSKPQPVSLGVVERGKFVKLIGIQPLAATNFPLYVPCARHMASVFRWLLLAWGLTPVTNTGRERLQSKSITGRYPFLATCPA